MTIVVFKQMAKKGQHIYYEQFKTQLMEFSKILNNNVLQSNVLDDNQHSDNNIQTQKCLEQIQDSQIKLNNIVQCLSSPKHQNEQPQENQIEIEQLKQKYEYILEQTKQHYQELIAELNQRIQELEKQLGEKDIAFENYKAKELSYEEQKLPSPSSSSTSKQNTKELETIILKVINKIVNLPNLGLQMTNQFQDFQYNPPLKNLKQLLTILSDIEQSQNNQADELKSQVSCSSQQSKNFNSSAQKQLQRKQQQLENKELEIIKLQKQVKDEQVQSNQLQDQINQGKLLCKSKDNQISSLQKKIQNQALLKKEVEKSQREIIELQTQIQILYYKLKDKPPSQLIDPAQEEQQIAKFLTPLKPAISFFPSTYSTYLSGTQSTSQKNVIPAVTDWFRHVHEIDKNKLQCANDMELKRKDIRTFGKETSFQPGPSALLKETDFSIKQ